MSEDKDMDALDDLFAQARADQPAPSDALLARIAADAVTWQPDPAPAPRRSLLAEFFETLGGWPALGGLATATVAGVYLGFVQPELLSTTGAAPAATETTGEDLADAFSFGLFPDDTLFFEEG